MDQYKDYKSKNCFVAYSSDIKSESAEKLIGKTIAKVECREYEMILILTDNSKLRIYGGRWDGCCLGIEYEFEAEIND